MKFYELVIKRIEKLEQQVEENRYGGGNYSRKEKEDFENNVKFFKEQIEDIFSNEY